jgi:quinohemoprotein ethanol dehydrogenase
VGINNGPDLRRSGVLADSGAFRQIVQMGIQQANGMPRFQELEGQRLEDLRHFLRVRAADLRGDAAGVKLDRPARATGL